MLTTPLFWLAAGYLLGAVPFGLLLARARGIDIRAVGSGNIGATNVLRTGNKGLAAATLLLDAGKGAVAVLLATHFASELGNPSPALAGFGAFIGHVFPVWLWFRGGKGVATMLGVTLGLFWPLGVIALLVWLMVALGTRYSSVGGMAAAFAAPLCLTFAVVASGAAAPFTLTVALAVTWLMALILVWKHGDNIARLRAGTESRIGRTE